MYGCHLPAGGRLFFTSLAVLTLSLMAPNAQAILIHYGGSGYCEGGGCSAFGLNQGDTVNSTIIFEESAINVSGRSTFNPSDPAFDFEFQFGALRVGKQHLMGLSEYLFDEARYEDMSVRTLTAQIDSVTSMIISSDFVTLRRGDDRAYCECFWLWSGRRTASPPVTVIQEPPSTWLLFAGLGLLWTRSTRPTVTARNRRRATAAT